MRAALLVPLLFAVTACGGAPSPPLRAAAPTSAPAPVVPSYADDAAFARAVLPAPVPLEERVSSLAVSPDGRWLVAPTSRGLQLWGVGAEGALEPLGEANLQKRCEEPTFTADPHVLVSRTGDAVLVHAVEGGLREVARWSAPESIRAHAVAAGGRIVAATPSSLFVLHLEGTHLVLDHTLAFPRRSFTVELSRDGRWLARTAPGGGHELQQIDARAGTLTPHPLGDATGGAIVDLASWSGHVVPWRVAATGAERLASSPVLVARSPERRLVARGLDGGVVEVARLVGAGDGEERLLLRHTEVETLYGRYHRASIAAVAIHPSGRWVYAATANAIQTLSVEPAAPAAARIGGDLVTWEPSGPIEGPTWPELTTTAALEPRGDGTVVARIEVVNAGPAPATEVTASLQAAARGRGVATLRVVVGSVPAGGVVRRHVTFPLPAAAQPTQIKVLTAGAHGTTAPPTLDVVLPRITRDAADYDELARAIFDLSVREVRAMLEVTAGSRVAEAFQPKLSKLGPDDFGFFASGDTVRYQNIHALNPGARARNREAMAARTDDEVTRHGEMMLLWYLPHEVIHTARAHLGLASSAWPEEYVANAMAPGVLHRVLAQLPDLGYALQDFDWIAERYETRLRPRVPTTDAQTVETYLATEGARGSLGMSPAMAVVSDPATYVWFCVRNHQRARAMNLAPDELRDRYFRPLPPPKK